MGAIDKLVSGALISATGFGLPVGVPLLLAGAQQGSSEGFKSDLARTAPGGGGSARDAETRLLTAAEEERRRRVALAQTRFGRGATGGLGSPGGPQPLISRPTVTAGGGLGTP